MNSQWPEIRVIISGGGTGGHIFPAIAIAHALRKLNERNAILFVGAKGRMEMEKVPAAGFPIEGLNISGIQRKLTVSNFALPYKVIQSVIRSRSIIRSFRPHVAVGVGGYASGPLLYAATSLGIPALIQEQNSYAGVTNKLLSKRVQRICVAYPGMERFFPQGKILLTGNPVRQDILDIQNKKTEALHFFGLDPRKSTLLVIGGSLGARTINRSIRSGLQLLAERGIQLIWQTGRSYHTEAMQAVEGLHAGGIKVFDFIQRMDLAYAAADVVVSRAGASSVSELEIVAKPSVLVPSPNVAEDHQTRNARALVDRDAAWMVPDDRAEAELVQKSLELIADKKKQEELISRIRELALPGAAATIAGEIYALATTKQ